MIVRQLSVVIATLGGPTLFSTILHLNASNVVPFEIIICIPNSLYGRVVDLRNIANVRIVTTGFTGQVRQRSFGLKLARGHYVMQMDDDILVEPNTIGRLIDALETLGCGNAVAPIFRRVGDHSLITLPTLGIRGLCKDVFYTFVCGAKFGRSRFGTISSSGIGFGVAPTSQSDGMILSEWLPGGAVLVRRSDLITHDYYPFDGRAYSEDIIHSIEWSKKGVRLWTDIYSFVLIHSSAQSQSLGALFQRYRVYCFIAEQIGGNKLRTAVWLVINIFRVLIAYIFSLTCVRGKRERSQ